jgi:hypothetical protein
MNSNLFTAKKAELGIECLRERESDDLELFIDVLPKLINWKLSE